jgi:D-sedoheptulose 7-phosphate isomerase
MISDFGFKRNVMSKRIKEIISASIETKQKILADEKMLQTICDAVNAIADAFKNGKKVLFCGNAGSAADAQHLACRIFWSAFIKDRTALPSEALHCNTSY